MNRAMALCGLAWAAIATPVMGQGMDHAGHAMPASPPSRPPDPPAKHDGHDMGAMPGGAMPGGAMPGDLPGARLGTDLPPAAKPAPARFDDHLADRYWSASAMAASRADVLRREHGGMTFYQVMFNLAEYQARRGQDGYRWEGEAWVGGDMDRLWLKTQGEGRFGRPIDSAEVQLLFSHALDPYWNVQAGVRQDIQPAPSRTYATVGIEGLAPYWFELSGALFLSDKGEVLARAESDYDQRITNYLTLQPRVEANFSAQDIPETGTGSGLTELEAGLRLRYEGSRAFAPYIGIAWDRLFGDTARYRRGRGEGAGGIGVVAGVRTWF